MHARLAFGAAVAALTACHWVDDPDDPVMLQPPLDADFVGELEHARACPGVYYMSWTSEHTIRLQVYLDGPGTFDLSDDVDGLPRVVAYSGECLIIRDCNDEQLVDECEQRLDHRYGDRSGLVTMAIDGVVRISFTDVVLESLDGDPDIVLEQVSLPATPLE